MGLNGFYIEYYMFILPAIAFVLIAQGMVSSRFRRYSKVRNQQHVSGREAAERILHRNGILDVSVQPTTGRLSDHYHPARKVIYLSQEVYNSDSVAAVGIAAHEAGHAVQHAQRYAFLKLRTYLVPVCTLGSNLALPLILLGMILSANPFINIGIALFSLAVLFQLITLPVEFNASRRALQYIRDDGMLVGEEYSGAKKVLTAAAMTYVAALAQSIMTLLYYISRFSRRR